MTPLSCIILAAGRSQRFPAPRGKITYPFIGRPLSDHVIALAQALFSQVIVVLSPSLESWFYEQYGQKNGLSCVIQHAPKGTWDALLCALPSVTEESCVTLNGDSPLIAEDTLRKLCESTSPFSLVTAHHPHPQGFGRIMRDVHGSFIQIREDRDIPFSEKQFLYEVNAGLYRFNVALLKTIAIEKSLSCHEWYLTAIWSEGSPFIPLTQLITEPDYRRVQGINTWADFERAEQYFYQIQRELLVRQGAILQNCSQIFIHKAFPCQPGVELHGPCTLQGALHLGEEAKVAPYSYIENTRLENHVNVGPFAKITENSLLKSSSVIGSFVEVKRSTIGEKTKAKHLAYIADATFGHSCNIGAFVVTCNYDGHKKHKTLLGNSVFVGAASQLIAPIQIAHNAYVGAGTTLTHSLEENVLVTRRAPLKMRTNFKGGQALCAELSQE